MHAGAHVCTRPDPVFWDHGLGVASTAGSILQFGRLPGTLARYARVCL
jgi:hypothetical protein